ncbi:MAG: serine/threonine-protein kinase [Pseudomonadota bacterium]
MQNDDDKTRPLSDKTQVKKAGSDKTRQLDNHAQVITKTPTAQSNIPYLSRDLNFQSSEPIESIADLIPGAIIKQRFKLEKCIGQGGMGTIFLALDLRKEELNDSDPYVAIKFLNEELHNSLGAIVALQREARKSQTLSHPNIVTVYDFDRENDIFYLSMEYLRGESFDQYISRKANRNEKHTTLMRHIEFMARGLAYAHQEGFVHADFKPANVFLTEQEQVKILDFGIAQAVRHNLAAEHPDDSLFDPVLMGAMTPNYASLEMLNYERPVPADDVYALAVVAYELLGGVAPYRQDGKRINAKQAFTQGIQAQPIPGVPKRVMTAILKGLSFKREDRFTDAGKFIDAIKPRVKIRQSIVALIAVLIIAVLVSWGITVNKTEAVIGFDDLPPTMNSMVETIKTADTIYAQGDIDQAHKLYVQAWEAAVDNLRADSRDLFKLKVILDRRIDKIIENFIARAEAKDLTLFSAMQLQMTLEFLQQSELGTLDPTIAAALVKLQKNIDSKESQ